MLYITACIVIGLLQSITAFQFRGVKINVTDSRVRATSTYTFYLDRTVDKDSNITPWDQVFITPSDNITITFPIQQYTVDNSYRCASLTIDGANVPNFMCIRGTNQIILRNFITTNTHIKTVVLTVSGIINPSPGGTTGNFSCSIGNDIGLPSFFSNVILTANSFSACSAIFNNVYGNTTGQLRFTTSSVRQLSNSAYLKVTFPFFWTRDVARQFINFAQSTNCSSAMV